MPVDILVPPLSQTSDSLLLLEWLNKPGDKVVKGEALFIVETDKASLEVESPESGILYEVYAKPQTEIAVRSVIGKILKDGEPFPLKTETDKIEPLLTLEKNVGVASMPRLQKESVGNLPNNRFFSSPRARKLAKEKKLDLSKAVPTGTRGMVVERDALSLLEVSNQSSIKSPVPMSHIRQVIAKRMLESHLETAPVSYMRETDVTNLVNFRNQILAEISSGEIRPTFTDFFIFIICKALQQHPHINSTFENGQLIQHSFVNLSLAVDTDRGLIVPVLQNAELLSIPQITKQRKMIIDKTINGKLTQVDLLGGTFTLTNLGALGIDFFTPIINPPQVAILGIGRIRELPVMKDEIFTLKNVIGLSLTCDHRVIDGAPAARFLDMVCQLIETPTKTWM